MIKAKFHNAKEAIEKLKNKKEMKIMVKFEFVYIWCSKKLGFFLFLQIENIIAFAHEVLFSGIKDNIHFKLFTYLIYEITLIK